MVVETAPRTEFEMDKAVASLNALLGIFGRLYMHFTNSVLETSGQYGEMTVRHHLRQFGHFRGTEMREAHHAMGKPINMETITCFWDNASTYVIHDDMEAGKYTPSDSSFDSARLPSPGRARGSTAGVTCIATSSTRRVPRHTTRTATW